MDEAPEDMDPYELMDPVEILSKMPKDYYEKIVSIGDVCPLCTTLKILNDAFE